MSVMLIAPVRWPAEVGVNVTAIEQFAPAASELAHVLVCAKSPLAVMPEMLSAALPVLVSVMFCAALVVCTYWLANDRLEGVSDTTGAGLGFEFELLLLPQANCVRTKAAATESAAIVASRRRERDGHVSAIAIVMATSKAIDAG